MWPNLQETADLVTFIEEILNAKLHFLYSVSCDYFPGANYLKELLNSFKINNYTKHWYKKLRRNKTAGTFREQTVI